MSVLPLLTSAARPPRAPRRPAIAHAAVALAAALTLGACGGAGDATGPGGPGGGGGGGGGATVASLTLSQTSASVQVGGTVTLTATPKDASGNVVSGQTVTWSSDASGVASVNSSTGVVTGVAPGTATITAAVGGAKAQATITVTPVPVASVTVAPASAGLLFLVQDSVTLGRTQLTATTRDAAGATLAGRVVTWGSSNNNVATVDGSGLVKATGAGSATITATSEGQKTSIPVTVTVPPVAQVVVTPSAPSIRVGEAVTFDVQKRDAAGNVLVSRFVTVFVSPAQGVVSVNGNVATGVAPGTATITYQSEGVGGSATVTVTP